MPITLNHTLVHARDRRRSARFLAEVLGLAAEPYLLGPFAVVEIGPTSLDFIDSDGTPIEPQHYAFLVDEAEFDRIYACIRERAISHWADPARSQPDRINHWDDGRGVYFADPDGHLLEVITRPYGSGGATARCPFPLARRVLDDA